MVDSQFNEDELRHIQNAMLKEQREEEPNLEASRQRKEIVTKAAGMINKIRVERKHYG